MGAFVYVMAADNGEVKVGWSGTPYARLSKVRREYSARRGFRDIGLVGMVRTAAFVETEVMAHGRLEPFAVGGEWFRLDAEAALAIVLECARHWDQDAEVGRPRARAPRAA